MSGTATASAVTTRTFRVWIGATPEEIWRALTDPESLRRYGYGGHVEFDLRPGGAYRVKATEEMLAFGAPEVMLEGVVREVDGPHRLVHTWHALWDDRIASEPATTVTYELEPGANGVTKLRVTHELEGAPTAAAIVSGEVADAGGGWSFLLSDLKTLHETGSPLPPQMG
jgi:uncharacterized protein YndB with AHSA1/START domain